MLISLKKLSSSRSLPIFVLLFFIFNSFNTSSGQTLQKNNATEGLIISDVHISGNRRVEKELIQLNVESKSGEFYSLEKVREDLKRIYRLGYFENVYIETDKSNGNIEVFYIVDEKPVIVDLRVAGNDKIKDKYIEEVMRVREGEIIDFRKVDSSLNAIRSLYVQRGFIGTEVEYEIEPEGDGKVTLVYSISEGKTAYIKKVVFIGNDNIKDKIIKKRIYSRPKSFLSFLTKKGLYNIDEIERDKDRIKAVYLDYGYLEAAVSRPQTTYLEDKKGYEVEFSVNEGQQFKVESVSFEGDFTESSEKLEKVTSLKPGEVFNSSKVTDDITRLKRYFGNQGFAFANIAPRFTLDKEKLVVNIDYQVERGKRVYVRFIDITGNIHTRDQVVRREIRQQEQSLYKAVDVDSIKPIVTRLGFFEDNIQVDQSRVAGTDDLLDILVKVEEKPTGFFSIAGGFSSVESLIFSAQVREDNLFGYGKRASLNLQIGGVTKILSLDYSDPNFIGTDYVFGFSAFYSDREFRDFDRKAWGSEVRFGKLLYKNLTPRVAYRLENIEISDVDRDARLIITESDRIISSLAFSLIWDSRNNFLDPTKGNLSVSTIEYAGPFGGNTDFIKYTVSVKQWLPIKYGTFLALSGIYGLIDIKNAGNDLIVSERFFLGGPNLLRGFGFRRVGTRVTAEDGDYIIIGGVQQLVMSADFIFPILTSAGLRGVLFYEMGNTFNDGENLSLNLSDLRKDYGFGIRWLSPLGPLKLEVGIPIGERLIDEESYEVQFTIGSPF